MDPEERRLLDPAIEEAMKSARLLQKERPPHRLAVTNIIVRAYLGQLGVEEVQSGLTQLGIRRDIVAERIFMRVNRYASWGPGARRRIDQIIEEEIGQIDKEARMGVASILAHASLNSLPAVPAIDRLITLGVDAEAARHAVLRASAPQAAAEPAEPDAAEIGTSPLVSDAVSELVEELKKVTVLRPLPDEALELMAARVQTVRRTRGEAIVRQGGPGDALYLISEGSVRVERDGRWVATLEAGTVVGEMALITGARRNATVLVDSPTATFLRLTREDFEWFSRRFPAFRHALERLAQARLPLFRGEVELINSVIDQFQLVLKGRTTQNEALRSQVVAILTQAYLGQLGLGETEAQLTGTKLRIPLGATERAFFRVNRYASLRPRDRVVLDPIISTAMNHGQDGPLSEDTQPGVANVLANVYLGALDGVSANGRLIALGVDREHAGIAVRQAARPAPRPAPPGVARGTARR